MDPCQASPFVCITYLLFNVLPLCFFDEFLLYSTFKALFPQISLSPKSEVKILLVLSKIITKLPEMPRASIYSLAVTIHFMFPLYTQLCLLEIGPLIISHTYNTHRNKERNENG